MSKPALHTESHRGRRERGVNPGGRGGDVTGARPLKGCGWEGEWICAGCPSLNPASRHWFPQACDSQPAGAQRVDGWMNYVTCPRPWKDKNSHPLGQI